MTWSHKVRWKRISEYPERKGEKALTKTSKASYVHQKQFEHRLGSVEQ